MDGLPRKEDIGMLSLILSVVRWCGGNRNITHTKPAKPFETRVSDEYLALQVAMLRQIPGFSWETSEFFSVCEQGRFERF